MATLTVQLPDDVTALAEERAAQAGYADVGQYLAGLIRGDAAAAPEGLTVHSDEDVEALLSSRRDGASVEMDEADFRQMRQKLESRLGPRPGARP